LNIVCNDFKKIFDRFIDRLKRKKYTNLKLFFEIHLNKDQILRIE